MEMPLRKCKSIPIFHYKEGSKTRPAAASLPKEFEEDDRKAGDAFVPDSEAVDDETTFVAKAKLGREMSAQDEVEMLKRESES